MVGTDVFQLVGERVGAFQVERIVASGELSVVYRATHLGFSAPVALKCLRVPPQVHPTVKARFRDLLEREGQLLFRLASASSGVVRPLHVDFALTPSGLFMPFLALEWLEGLTLEQLVEQADERCPKDLDEWVARLGEVAETLETAHRLPLDDGQRGVLHRDIKPSNLFLTSNPGQRVKVLDFGIAEVCSVFDTEPGRSLDATGSATLRCFTPAYAAPEQWDPGRYGMEGPWTDVWGLALTVSRLCTARGGGLNAEQPWRAIALDPDLRPSPRNLGLPVSDATEAVFLKALAVEPTQRYVGIAEFWAALHGALRSARSPLVHRGGQRLFEEGPALELGSSNARAAGGLELDMGAVLGLGAANTSQEAANEQHVGGRPQEPGVVTVFLAPTRVHRARRLLTAHLAALVWITCALLLVAANRWVSLSGGSLHLGAIPLSAVVVAMLVIAGAQVLVVLSRTTSGDV